MAGLSNVWLTGIFGALFHPDGVAAMSFVAILMGSDSDWPIMQATVAVLKSLEIEHEVRVTSAHRTPIDTAEYVTDAVSRDCGVFICAAGLAAHLHRDPSVP